MDVDFLRPGTAPIPADTVFWYEYLVNPSLLQKHLLKDDPDPSPVDLIIQFLANASGQKENEKIDAKPIDSENGEAKTEEAGKNKKCLALRLLALKIASYLNWNLNILESRLPLPLQQMLLQDVLYFTMEQEVDIQSHKILDLNVLPSYVLFALSLYHRWVVRAVKTSRMPVKPVRTPAVPVPGQQNPTIVLQSVIEGIVQTLDCQVPDSIELLDSLLQKKETVSMPVFDTFTVLTEDGDASHNWTNLKMVSFEEFTCQVSFDLGCHYFFREEYTKAKEYLSHAHSLHKEHDTESGFCLVDSALLQGYCVACKSSTVATVKEDMKPLVEQLHISRENQYRGIFGILQKDNLKKEVPLIYRDTLELDILAAAASGKFTVAKVFPFQVQTYNVVRRVLEGRKIVVEYTYKLKDEGAKGVEILVNALKSILHQITVQEKRRVKEFLNCLIESEVVELAAIIPNTELKSLFSSEELDYISSKALTQTQFLGTGWEQKDYKGNKNLEIGELEKRLIHSYSASHIRDLLQKLATLIPIKPLWTINQKWDLPIPIHSAAMALPKGFLQDYCFIMMAKSKELTNMKSFKEAAELLQAVESHCNQMGNMALKLTRLISWEILLVEIIQFLHMWPRIANVKEITNKCKACLAVIHVGDTVIPRAEVVEHCVVFLVNVCEWDYLLTLDTRWSHLELASALADVCQDVIKSKGTRKDVPDLWKTILPIFTMVTQQKRSSMGTATKIQRDSPQSVLNRVALAQFLDKIREPTALSILISLLARLHNILKDEPSQEIGVEHSFLCLGVAINPISYNIKAVGEYLTSVLQQALKYYPTNVTWLKIMGDLKYVMGHYAEAMKYYLEAAVVSSDYFSQPVPRQVLDDGAYKRMIRCCSQLQCYTQAALLCLFPEEPDYMTAFKCLQEKNCADAMDAYYNCIWDVTVLEYLVYIHAKRGEVQKKQQALNVMGLLEINSNNNEEIQREASNVRKGCFLRALTRQYL